jgi:xylulose-5-phosphate/fructose-6-phosphate phosphoketolase
VHADFAAALDEALDAIATAKRSAARPKWPMIVLRTPKGWTGPRRSTGSRSRHVALHQVPMSDVRGNPAHLAVLEEWMRSYRPEELFDEGGRLVPELAALPPRGEKRMSASPHANGGVKRDLVLPDFRDYAIEVKEPAAQFTEATRALGTFLRDVVTRNPENFRIFGPDETASNRLGDVFEVTARQWVAEILRRTRVSPRRAA